MKLIKRRQYNFAETIKICYESDLSLEQFSRNNDVDLNGRIQKEIECLNNMHSSFKFYDIFNDNKLIGYFGIERQPVQCLSTFFIMPEFRQNKKQIWKFIRSHLPKTFYAGLFAVNKRAIQFFEKNGGKSVAEIIWEDKPSIVFKFER